MLPLASLRRAAVPWFLLLLPLGCTHSDAFVTPSIPSSGPFSGGANIQLTFNVDQSYWPTWTQDGRGILYSFVNLENTAHRCLGLLPAGGGTRIWQLCDNRAVRDDSVTSYPAYALDSTGRLLLVEALSAKGFASSFPFRVRLQLTDTATPSVRTTLLTLPVTVGNTPVTWLSDIAWTGPNTFMALGQQYGSEPHCSKCQCFPCPLDSLFADSGGVVLRGTIAGGQASLQAIAGTEGATSYSLAENGAAIVFTLKFQPQLFQVPSSGGAPTPTPAPVSFGVEPPTELVGVSCQASTCIVARDAITLSHAFTDSVTGNGVTFFGAFNAGAMELHRISLSTGADDVIQSNALKIFATPQISPVSGDLVVQLGGVWGHLQTHATAARGNGELHLLKGFIP